MGELEPRKREIVLHGHHVSYRTAGEGDAIVLLIHGIVGCANQWDPVARLLAERYTVVAPDLLGHGESAKPRGDYSLGAYAASVRDLLVALGHRRATVVGHSPVRFAQTLSDFIETTDATRLEFTDDDFDRLRRLLLGGGRRRPQLTRRAASA